ncbi:hypothetical protein [Streptomyces rapamycinicus]|uniref:Aminoglycoside phosphotransferase domain-containing protein n=2 Tax=Streptomyces rapamycinicus TaxID=1226757 RepID=A0A0A0ND74_STRRN|nr:hypothetical protein [Streptomyces rapamycinicus]AGP57402.1 hypothetical protein M271_29795 [Streptomyces rapamycinicus NRRL 5491]MBB4785055.1 hypothetical protein [Streptomyces rapamycinicus]RLV79469.1 hypothetical protein D3C57_113830 [Streptomyces rapamycinicus NRRL 5491]UTO65282.1 hypothetical protein LJB45_25145 [Streptomyces rapamycinicus]UTP33238.1 hypothetical protein LIV37_30275 [Streptomyces rapamycinicus NRRL 5491]
MSNGRPPEEFWSFLQPYTGLVTDVELASCGFSVDLTALVRCEKGPFFVKAMPNRPGGRRDFLVREALVNPEVKPVAPALLWRAEDEGWIGLDDMAGAARAWAVRRGAGA